MFTMRYRPAAVLTAILLIAGCQTNSTKLIPNPDRDLRKPPEAFKEDAAKRVYPASQPSPFAPQSPAAQQAPFRGEVDYALDVINIVNLSNKDWDNVEVWANGKYVCFVPSFPAKMQRGIAFRILFSPTGERPPFSGLWLDKVELVKDGKIYQVEIHPAD